jgi:hypothetical protein
MSTSSSPQHSTRNEHRTLYIVTACVLVVLMVIGLITYRPGKSDRAAEDKANQLIAALQQAGATHVPSQEQIVGVLGTDGGATCADPTKALAKSTFLHMLFNGAGGPGARPIVADSRVVKGQLLIIQIYCPEYLDEFKKFVDDLKTGNVVNE